MTDESWDYYLATGEDPTGGRIDPDFDMGSDDQEDKVVYVQDVPDDGLSPLERWIDDMLVMLDKKR